MCIRLRLSSFAGWLFGFREKGRDRGFKIATGGAIFCRAILFPRGDFFVAMIFVWLSRFSLGRIRRFRGFLFGYFFSLGRIWVFSDICLAIAFFIGKNSPILGFFVGLFFHLGKNLFFFPNFV